METMNISLPGPLKEYVEAKVAAGGYSSASEYVRELVRADQKRQASDELEHLLLGSIRSGEPIDVTPEMVDEVRSRLRSRAASRGEVKH